MASFTALNIEPDDQIDDEVDNTKEIQIEEALKLYQAALRLHSQGPALYSQAAEAYSNLFKSDIFKYPESITEFARIDEHPELELVDTSFPLDLDLAAAEADASSLPQVLYLSFKNHGQFILDCVKARLQHPDLPSDQLLDAAALRYQGLAALDNFTLALARDESDTELWRRTARIAAMLGSKRITRYCLEAAVEVDDDPTVAEVEPSTLEEGFAGEALKERLEVIADDVALSHPIMAPFLKRSMPAFLKKHIDPYPYLPDPSRVLESDASNIVDSDTSPSRTIIEIPDMTWTSLGDELVMLTISPAGFSGAGIIVRFPETAGHVEQRHKSAEATPEDQLMKDLDATASPVVDKTDAAPAAQNDSKPEDQPPVTTTTTTTVPLNDERGRSQSIALPTRKRSQSAAGIRDTPEDDSGTQKRSKRIRNRDTTTEVDPATQYAEQLKVFVDADEALFTFVGDALKKLDIDDLGTFSDLQAVVSSQGDSETSEVSEAAEAVPNNAIRDLWNILKTWDDDKASTFQNANAADILGSSAAGGANAGLAAFLEHSKTGPTKVNPGPAFDVSEGVLSFAKRVEDKWMSLQDVVFEWLCAVLITYRRNVWPEDLKGTVVRAISFADPDIFDRIHLAIDHASTQSADKDILQRLQEMIQTLFELHLDIYSRITNPSSIVHYETRVMTKERLDRWAKFAAEVIQSSTLEIDDELSLRYLWASVFYATMAENSSREHNVLCWSDLKSLLSEKGDPTIELQNNAVMPELSAAAAEREVSRLMTMDFFYNLFQTDTSNPAAIIETLEPVLDPESACERTDSAPGEVAAASETSDSTPAALRDMWKFLKTGSTSLRLFLWQRLREAYSSIDYNTKVFSCYLKSIEIIVADLQSDEHVHSADEPRYHQMLLWLKALDDLLVRSLTIALNDASTCFEIIDERHIKTTCAALAQLNRILHASAIYDDEVKLGMTILPQTPAYAVHGSFMGLISKLREMQVRTWSLQYSMMKEAVEQNRELFPNPEVTLPDLLTHIHYALGIRKFCRSSNKIFLKMMKVEMIRLKPTDLWEDYLGQVLFDLYGIKLGFGTFFVEDHGCPTEPLDRRTVLNIAEQIINLANKLSMKDLLKHELRTTIEKMQTSIGPAKSTPQMTHNLRNITEYIKGSIRPLQMYRALRGQVEIDCTPVLGLDNGIAEKGWYFLQGMIALTKFRSQKRLGPGGQTDDMRISATFMRLQLQYTADHWETWYRLAQCFDFELEDEVMWTADKINNNRPELVRMQRGAIHCYIMAISTAVRTADDSVETAAKLSEMYHNFGMRLYASSREPFTMEAFYLDEFERHFSGPHGMYKKALHTEMNRFKLWMYTAHIFKKALADGPNNWMNHYMRGKCLWKAYYKIPDEWAANEGVTKPPLQSILDAFVKSIDTAPRPKDSRQDPILEPHYKLVSIVHKLVMKGDMEPQAGADLLQEQPFKIRKGEIIAIQNLEEWEPFVLESLRHLRTADKTHWHHRMIARVANILYNENKSEYEQAVAARAELWGSIFTKTMYMQVWKPEAERPGRHCVYMERYVLLMCSVLSTLNDKSTMEQLVKRVRKKGHELFHFNKVWNECCSAYVRLIRREGQIPVSMDEVFKGIPADEFEDLSERLAVWMNTSDASHQALEALREATDLKKLNANQMKSAPIDDLINDSWAVLYTQVAQNLPAPDPSTVRTPPSAANEGVAPRPAGGPMGLNTLIMNMDGNQIPVPVTFASSSEHSRSRKVGISRREILRKAESAMNRAPDATRPAPPSTGRSRTAEPNSAGTAAPADTGNRSSRRPELPAVRNIKDDDNLETGKLESEQSAPGSLHDSADDESDLTDVGDEDPEPVVLFPGLMKDSNETKDEDAEAPAVNGSLKGSDAGAEHDDV